MLLLFFRNAWTNSRYVRKAAAQYSWVPAWRTKDLNPRAKANGFLGSRPVISNAPGREVITAADCADRKVRHSKGTPHAERGA